MLIDVTIPSSEMACLDAITSISAQHKEYSYNAISTDIADQCVTSKRSGQLDGFSNQSPITATKRILEDEANISDENNHIQLVPDEPPEKHKKRSECLGVFQEIQDVLRDQLHQLQTVLFEGKNLEYMLQELPREETEVALLLAVRALSSSLVGVRHILKGNITMMEGLKSTSSLSKVAHRFSSSPAQQSPLVETPVTHTDSVETRDDSSDLLLGCAPPDLDITAPTDVDVAANNRPTIVWNIASPGADPFVDTPRKDVAGNETRGAIQLDLEFHPDFTNIPGRKLHVPASPMTGEASGVQSRRVILKNLPPDTALTQIIRGIRCYGEFTSINMLNTAPIFGDCTKTAMLEFVYSKAAADFTRALQSSSLIYEAGNGDQYHAEGWLIPSPSYALSRWDYIYLKQGRTRSLLIKEFPKECIWYFISTIGVNNIVHVEHDEINDVDKLIAYGRFSDFYQYSPQDGMFCITVGDLSQADANNYWPRCGIVKRLPQDNLDEQWNCYPYNDYVPLKQQNSVVPNGPTRLSLQERLSLQYDIEEPEVENFLHDLENHQDTDFRILGSAITLTRRKWGWSMKTEDETKLLMANTLHEPNCAEQWDEYFKARGEINLRKWEQYGMLARHRREKATEQGLGLETVPECGKECEMGCRDIRAAPVAAVVKQYIDPPKFTIIYAGVEV
ncbi:hypothetical protein V8C37DRAFT_413696 [Trichoderma ceciliae]